MSDDEILDAVVQHATDRAEELFPKRGLSIRARLALFLASFLIVSNTVLGIIDTAVLAKSASCNKARSAQLTNVRTADSMVVDKWVNHVTDELKQAGLTHDQLVKALDGIRNQYNKDRTTNKTAINTLVATTCK